MTIRHATVADVLAIVDLGKQLYDCGPWAALAPWDAGSFERSILTMLEGEVASVVLVAEREGRVIGTAACLVFPLYFNAGVSAAQELFWFVEPAHRNGIGRQLFAALERAAQGSGATIFCAASSTGLREDSLARVYARRGYQPAERTFMKAL